MNAQQLTHEAATGLFSAYLDAELAEPEQELLEGHLDGCLDCRDEWEQFSGAIALVRGVPRLRASRGFTRRVVARARRSRVRGLPAAARDLVTHRVHAEVATAIVLVAVLALLLVYLLAP